MGATARQSARGFIGHVRHHAIAENYGSPPPSRSALVQRAAFAVRRERAFTTSGDGPLAVWPVQRAIPLSYLGRPNRFPRGRRDTELCVAVKAAEVFGGGSHGGATQ